MLDEIVEKSLTQAAIWDEVKDRLKKSALGLSGGQQQRLCIARALAVEPEVLLMDESTSALDPISTGKIEELALELKKQYTIITVTHQYAAGGPDFGQHRLLPPGRHGGVRQDGADFLLPPGQADGGLHHREVWIMRTRFDQELGKLNVELITMGALCEEAIGLVAGALTKGRTVQAADINALEVRIDHKERDIESLCMKLLLQQQPVAGDLRVISSALKMISDMERIGDQGRRHR